MYIFELIAQAFKKKERVEIPKFDPMNTSDEDLIEDSDNCEHLFLPLDSSNTMFACKYCGLVVPREKLKNKNIFEGK